MESNGMAGIELEIEDDLIRGLNLDVPPLDPVVGERAVNLTVLD